MLTKRNMTDTICSLYNEGHIEIKNKSKQTVKNWTKTINNELKDKNYSWRVVCSVNSDGGIISAIPLQRYEAISGLL